MAAEKMEPNPYQAPQEEIIQAELVNEPDSYWPVFWYVIAAAAVGGVLVLFRLSPW